MASLSLDPRARAANARSAIALGAACALFGAALLGYDAPVSQAAGGLIDAVFSRSRPAAEIYYSYVPRYDLFQPPPRRLRLAKRPHDVQARRRLVERRRFVAHRLPSAVAQRRPVMAEAVPIGRNPMFRVWSPPTIALMRAARRDRPLQGAQRENRLDRTGAAPPAAAHGAAAPAAAFYADPTLRPGDTVVTPEGVRVLRYGSHAPYKETDFVSLAQAGAPLANRSALNEIDRVVKTPLGRAPADL
jgi:hypothetical protein